MLFLLWLTACQPPLPEAEDSGQPAGETDGPGDPGGTDVPSFSADILFLAIGDPLAEVPTAEWQDPLDGWTYAYDIADPDNPTYLCQHDQAGTDLKHAEWHLPTGVGCMATDQPAHVPEPGPDEPADTEVPADTDAPETFPPTHTGLPGRNPTPPGYTAWVGGAQGGCGTWSIAMCDRILGRTDATSQVGEAEWTSISTEIKLDPTDGSSNRFDRAAYYQARGYCVAEKRFDGTPEDYAELQEKVHSGTCDVKAMFYKRLPDESYTNGHVEVVVGAANSGFLTNSWGHVATVEGGSSGGFRHSGDGAWMTDDDNPGEKVWPPGSTEVVLQYVCPCTTFENLGRMILGG